MIGPDPVGRAASDRHRSRDALELRYERKALLRGIPAYEVELCILRHPEFFREIHHRRHVNSIYLDTVDFVAYAQNVEGDSEREKIRVRWYGELFGMVERGILEFKIKTNALGLKKQYPVRPFGFTQGCEARAIHDAIADSELPAAARLAVARQRPTMLIRYSRRYFQSLCGRFRITIDTDLEFYRTDGPRYSLLHRIADRGTVVLEIKYQRDADRDADRVISRLPYPLTKSSKYVYGLQRLWGSDDHQGAL